MTQSVSICTAHTSKEKYNGLNRLGYWLMEKKKKKAQFVKSYDRRLEGKKWIFQRRL